MTDLVAQFASLLEQSRPESGGGIELVLANLDPRQASVLRKTALTHQFTAEVLRVLEPELTPEEADVYFARFSRLSAVIRVPEGLALHDRVREHLFAEWLQPGRVEESRPIHERLAAYVAGRMQDADSSTREKLSRRLIFHRVGVDQNRGIDEFEDEFEQYRERLRFSACENLLRLVQEYVPILTLANRARVAYREAKLAFDRGDNDRALELFAAARDQGDDVVLRAKAWYGIGLAHDARRSWRKAMDAFNRALRFAETDSGAHYLRCRILRSLAAVYRDTGEIQRSEKLLNQALDLAREADDERGLAAAYNALGTLYHRANDPEQAIVHLNESLKHIPLDDFDRSRVYNNLGLAHLRTHRFDESERWFKRSLEVKSLGGDTLGQANTYLNLVRLYREDSSFDKSIEAATAAAELFSRVFAWREAGDARATLARLLAEHGDRERAEAAVSDAADAYARVHAEDDIAAVRKQVARALSGGRGRLPGLVQAALTAIGIVLALYVAMSLYQCSATPIVR